MKFLQRESLIDRLARESGWLVTKREGDYRQVRRDGGSHMDYIHIRGGEDSDSVALWTMFQARFAVPALTRELLMGLLARNGDLLFASWCLMLGESCECIPFLKYRAIRAGLTASAFDAICREMVAERTAVYRQLNATLTNGLVPAPGHGITWLNG